MCVFFWFVACLEFKILKRQLKFISHFLPTFSSFFLVVVRSSLTVGAAVSCSGKYVERRRRVRRALPKKFFNIICFTVHFSRLAACRLLG